jgi:DNA methylase
MTTALAAKSRPDSHRVFKNGEIHDWYRTVWGYSDHLVSSLLAEFATGNSRVLDPFCGSGTTLVECMKHGIECAGIDANPVSCFAATVKTNWSLNSPRLLAILPKLRTDFKLRLRKLAYREDATYRYLECAGMLERGWICEDPLKKAICLKQAINASRTDWRYREALTLALLNTVVRDAANIKFGPELYCGKRKSDVDVFACFEDCVRKMARDLLCTPRRTLLKAPVIEADARSCGVLRSSLGGHRFSLVISSPPYPTEHDYTRNSRLELAFLERVINVETLREIKKRMVRSNTKGIYQEDTDFELVAHNADLGRLARRIERRASRKTHGFAKLYARVALEYFGGMKRHLISISTLLRKGAVLAYVVGDQASYLQVPIQTAKLLGAIAQEVGYDLIGIRHLRDRQSSTTSTVIGEHILLLRKTG